MFNLFKKDNLQEDGSNLAKQAKLILFWRKDALAGSLFLYMEILLQFQRS